MPKKKSFGMKPAKRKFAGAPFAAKPKRASTRFGSDAPAAPYEKKPRAKAPFSPLDRPAAPTEPYAKSSGYRENTFEARRTGPKPFSKGKPKKDFSSKRDVAPKHRASKPAPEPTVVEMVTFAELGLQEDTLKAIHALGFEVPTPIQTLAIPALVSGEDMIGLAQTGTGKTAAFGLPLVERIDTAQNVVQALVLAPTRELAVQVAKGINDFGKPKGVRVVPVYGGQPIDRQFRALQNGAHVVIGTPGRVLDHIRRGSLNLDNVSLCVLDEGDEMMALGFTEDMEVILSALPHSRQLAFFSATMAPRVEALTSKYLRKPKRVEIVAKQRTLETTNQTYYEVAPGKKLEALARVLDMETPGSTIVFCRTRLETSELSDALRLRGYGAEAIHGEMNQAERERVLRRFRDGQVDLLIATDVAARGLDIDSVTHVVNYDVPYDVEQYIHRIGRTGRAGRTGDAITLIYHKERRKLENIERQIGSRIEPAKIPTISEIASRRMAQFLEDIKDQIEAGTHELMLPSAGVLSEDFDALEVAAAAMQLLWSERHKLEQPGGNDDSLAEYEQPEFGMVRIYIGMGRIEGLRPGDIVGAITHESGLNGKQVGAIDILDRASFVEVPIADGDRVVEALTNTKLRHKQVKVHIAQPAFGAEIAAAREERGARTKKFVRSPRKR